MALPAFYLYVVAEHYFQIVQTSFAKRKPTSAQAIAYYIKKAVKILAQKISDCEDTKDTYVKDYSQIT